MFSLYYIRMMLYNISDTKNVMFTYTEHNTPESQVVTIRSICILLTYLYTFIYGKIICLTIKAFLYNIL